MEVVPRMQFALIHQPHRSIGRGHVRFGRSPSDAPLQRIGGDLHGVTRSGWLFLQSGARRCAAASAIVIAR